MKTSRFSIWEGTVPNRISFSSLKQDLDTDVVIIGGGISGLTTALLLSQAGLRVVLLEARKLGQGTTGHSTGNLYCVVDEHLSGIRSKWNANVLKTVVDSRMAAIDLIEGLIQKYSIDCHFYRCSFHYYVEHLDAFAETFLQKEYDAAKEAGLNARFAKNLELPFKTEGGLIIPGQAQFHPLKYANGLVDVLKEQFPACQLFESTPVVGVDAERGTVLTAHASVRAKHVVMATHTPKGVCGTQLFLRPVREHGVACESKPDACPPGVFWSVNEPKRSIRSLKVNGQSYLLAVGEAYKTGHHQKRDGFQNLENYLKEKFRVRGAAYAWAGQAYRPADGLPYIGRQHGKVYLMTGFATDGLTYGSLAAMLVTDLILGVSGHHESKDSWEEIYRLDRFDPLKSAFGFARQGLDNLFHYAIDVPQFTHHSFRELARSEGCVIENGHEKLAVYKDAQGKVEAVSAVCTHMKCIVRWNAEEKTWDCPCHGSRFGTDGHVIEGPAFRNLERKILP